MGTCSELNENVRSGCVASVVAGVSEKHPTRTYAIVVLCQRASELEQNAADQGAKERAVRVYVPSSVGTEGFCGCARGGAPRRRRRAPSLTESGGTRAPRARGRAARA